MFITPRKNEFFKETDAQLSNILTSWSLSKDKLKSGVQLTWVEPCCFACEALWLQPPVRAASEGSWSPCSLLLWEEGAGRSEPKLCSSGPLSDATVHAGPNPSPARLLGVQLQRCHSLVSWVCVTPGGEFTWKCRLIVKLETDLALFTHGWQYNHLKDRYLVFPLQMKWTTAKIWIYVCLQRQALGGWMERGLYRSTCGQRTPSMMHVH